jgi:2H phosphodiesterase-like protein/predicted pore-forming effector associated with SMODS systems
VVYLLVGAFLIGNAAAWAAMKWLNLDLGSREFGVRWYSLTVFAVLFFLFNNYLWRLAPIRTYLDIPNLNGTWIGTVDRVEFPSGEREEDIPVTVNIKQDFTGMAFSLQNKVETTMSGTTISTSDNISISGSRDTGYYLRESFHTGTFFGTTVWRLDSDDQGAYMVGDYVSRVPRKGTLKIRRIEKRHLCRSGMVQRMVCESSEPYLAVSIDKHCGKNYLQRLGAMRGRSQVGEWSRNQVQRDRGSYHLTVVSPPELASLSADQVAQIESVMVDFSLGDIGGIETGDERTYYVIISSPHIDYLRKLAGLPHRDLHVTLAFHPDDIHGVPKGIQTRLV